MTQKSKTAELMSEERTAVEEVIVQLVTKLDLRASVFKAEDVEIDRPETKGVRVSQIIREVRETV